MTDHYYYHYHYWYANEHHRDLLLLLLAILLLLLLLGANRMKETLREHMFTERNCSPLMEVRWR